MGHLWTTSSRDGTTRQRSCRRLQSAHRCHWRYPTRLKFAKYSHFNPRKDQAMVRWWNWPDLAADVPLRKVKHFLPDLNGIWLNFFQSVLDFFPIADCPSGLLEFYSRQTLKEHLKLHGVQPEDYLPPQNFSRTNKVSRSDANASVGKTVKVISLSQVLFL